MESLPRMQMFVLLINAGKCYLEQLVLIYNRIAHLQQYRSEGGYYSDNREHCIVLF